ncbi:hypothetical protein EXIGLDRAFT_744715 [Exidia glandulosa HHB12029]|uniref:F-box domain-containing protein n=1 Tax=Exidia glandulosa HHB12029 TaxID=1314781 RepID=A0A165PJZ6_EXIGL|nr:hypothetical protein EXIGLDRAFT_744715 [Exidia glandulosa HHB12029]
MQSLCSPIFATLPMELVNLVLWHAAHTTTPMDLAQLARLALVSRHSNELATPFLYSTIVLDSAPKFEAFQNVLIAKSAAFFARYVQQLSISLPLASPDEHTMQSLIGLGATLSFVQAPLDILLGMQHIEREIRPWRKLSILPATSIDPNPYAASIRHIRLQLSTVLTGGTHLHFGGKTDDERDVLRRMVFISGIDFNLTHLSLDGDPIDLLQDEAEFLVWAEKLLAYLKLPSLERIVIRIPQCDIRRVYGSFLRMLAETIRDERVFVHFDSSWDPYSTASFAVDGWKRHVSGIGDFWMSGRPVKDFEEYFA